MSDRASRRSRPVGVALVTTAVISWRFVLPPRIRGPLDHPYVGMVIFLILAALFFTHLLPIPIGSYAGKRQIKGLEEPAFDGKAALDRLARFFGVSTLVSVVIAATKHLETPRFRGQACLGINPEFASYLNSACSRRQRADWRDARKYKLLAEITPLPSPVAI